MTSGVAALWFWAKVVLSLVALDALLFGTGAFWAVPISWQGTGAGGWMWPYHMVRQIETRPVDTPLVMALGSSVVGRTLDTPMVEKWMERLGVPGRFANMGMDGATACDAALIAGGSGRLEPWLVVYGAEARDFVPSPPLNVTETLFGDWQTREALPLPQSLDERISLLVKSYWKLYRYRPLARILLRQEAGRLLGWSTDVVFASPPNGEEVGEDLGRPRALPGARRAPKRADEKELWKRWLESRDFADYEAYLEARNRAVLEKYRERRAIVYDVESNPQVDSLRWMLGHYRSRGTRVLIAYFPENPAFRDPKASHLFDPAVSDRTAAMLAGEAKRFGAQFVDLRDLLPAEEFIDLLHANADGRKRIIEKMAQLIAEDWHARGEAASRHRAGGAEGSHRPTT